jgi:hypothetical protein
MVADADTLYEGDSTTEWLDFIIVNGVYKYNRPECTMKIRIPSSTTFT